MVKIRGFPDIFTLQLGKKNLLGLRKTNHVTYPTSHWGITIIPFLDDGKIYRKTLYLMVTTCKNPWVSCKFSQQNQSSEIWDGLLFGFSSLGDLRILLLLSNLAKTLVCLNIWETHHGNPPWKPHGVLGIA